MPAIKIQKFLGVAPKVSSELLPDGAGQIAYNTKLYSGDLIPYRETAVVDSVGRVGETQTLYGLKDPDTGAIAWLSWAGDIDVIRASDSSDSEQRIYYTGDGVPKVTYYARAINGAEPYPALYYTLGLPLPTTAPVATEASFAASTSASFARDSGNTATIVTGAAHGLRTGNVVSVRGFTGTPGTTFNATNVTATVVDTTTFTYYSPGDAVTTTADTNGTIDLAGNTQTRTYVYTWYSPWSEESIASDPSNEVFIKEGQTVTISSLPTTPPSGDSYVRGLRVYRTLPSASGTEYFVLSTCWFPRTTTTVSLTSNVASVTLDDHHNLIVGDKFKLSGCTDTVFNITDGVALSIVDDYTFTYAVTNADIAEKAETTGTCFFNVAELTTDTPVYWGDGGVYSFVDDFDYLNLVEALTTYDYDPPPSELQGITVGPNNMVFGFFGNQLCFAEPSNPHAWPLKYRRTMEYDIVAVESVGGYIVVLTGRNAFHVSGNDPATLSITKIDKPYPCLSKRSVVNMGYGVLYATHGGMALWSPSGGLALATEYVHDWDTWEVEVDPSTIVGTFFDDKYYGSHSTGAFIFERDTKIGGYYVTTNHTFTAAWTDEETSIVYTVSDDRGTITEWDSVGQPVKIQEWKSKTLVTADYLNLGAARVIADYTLTDAEVAALNSYNTGVPAYNAALWLNAQQLDTVNGPTDFSDAGVRIINFGELNSSVVHGDNQTQVAREVPATYSITFKLFVNKELVFTTTRTSDAIFRLPSGYRSDTFEVSVAGRPRIRAIHLGETPYGLRSA